MVPRPSRYWMPAITPFNEKQLDRGVITVMMNFNQALTLLVCSSLTACDSSGAGSNKAGAASGTVDALQGTESPRTDSAVAGSTKAAAVSSTADVLQGTESPRTASISLMLNGASADTRSRVDAALPQIQQQLVADIEDTKTNPRPSEQIASFLTKNDKILDNLVKPTMNLHEALLKMEARQDEPTVNSAADIKRIRDQVADKLSELVARERIVPTALQRDPVVAQAYRLWRAQTTPSLSIAGVHRQLLTEPCRRDWSAQPSSESFLNFRGAALGMTEGEAIKGLCAENDKSVSIVRVGEGRTHQEPDDRDPALAGLGAVKATLAKPYRMQVDFCLDCLASAGQPGQPYSPGKSDIVTATFFPDGRIRRLERRQAFVDRAASGQTDAPRKLNLLLPPLEKRFGQASFTFDTSRVAIIGWVYPDGKSPLPLEAWYVTTTKRFSDELHFKSTGLIYENGKPSRKLLARQKPVATACLAGTGYIGSIDNGLIGGSPPIAATDKCGVTLVARFTKLAHGGVIPPAITGNPDRAPALDGNANIYNIEMSLSDYDGYWAWVKKERQEIIEAGKQSVAKLEKDAANPAGRAFTP